MPSLPHLKIGRLRLLLIVFVVMIHTKPQRVMLTGPQGIDSRPFLCRLVDPGLTAVAVPMFALLAGFLFFFDLPLEHDRYRSKIRRRVRSLVVPYLICSAANLGLLLLLQNMPASRSFFTRDPAFLVADMSAGQLVRNLLVRPIPLQLWFIRDLIVLVALSPLIGLAVTKLRWWPILPFAAAWVVRYAATPDERVFLASTTTAFFMWGAYLAIHAPTAVDAIPRWRRLSLPLWFIAAGLFTWSSIVRLPIALQFFAALNVLIGIAALWWNADLLSPLLDNRWLRWLPPMSFFIFLAHQPLLRNVERIASRIPLMAERSELFLILAMSAVTILICAAMAAVMQRVAPRFYGLLTGGR